MKHKLVAVLLVVVVLGSILTACGKETVEVTKIVEKEKIVEVTAVPAEKRPVIKVGQNVGNSPWVFNEGGTIVGFETEMVREALDRLGYDMEVVDVPFAGIFAGLQADKWQIAASSIFIKKERVEQMDFSDPWFDDYESFVVPVGSDIQSLEDLKGKTIGTESGTSHDAYLNSLMEEYGPFEIKGYDRRAEWVLDLQAGRIDAGVGDFASDAYYIADKPDLEQRTEGWHRVETR